MDIQWGFQEEILGDNRVKITLTATSEEWESWGNRLLDQVRGKPHGELRVSLPRGWTLFWKWRHQESKFLVAHPEEQEWVATLSLSDAVVATLESSLFLGTLNEGADPLVLNELDGGYGLSNLVVALGVSSR